MADNTLFTRSNGQKVRAQDHNSYYNAFKGDLVPRNSSGAPTSEAGNLGTSTYKWKNAHIVTGYLFTGAVLMFHDFNGAVSAGQGWMKLNGDTVNETDYDSQHSSGDWSTYVGSSPLSGKQLPDINNKYPVGSTNTTQDGSSSITSVGNANHSANHSHSHQVDDHNHAWLFTNLNQLGHITYDSSGTGFDFTSAVTNNATGQSFFVWEVDEHADGTNRNYPEVNGNRSFYTSNENPSTDSSLVSADVQPESIEFEFWMRIV